VPERGDLMTIDEVIVRAEFEPSMIDVYVEGADDAAVISSFLHEHSL